MEKIDYTFAFTEGCIDEKSVSAILFASSEKHKAGAGCSFWGKVREDEMDGKKVQGIHFSSNKEMAQAVIEKIFLRAQSMFGAHSIHVLHGLGDIKKGELCFFVHCTTPRRKESFEVCEYLVECIKKEAPIWGKEYFEDKTHTWKINKP